MAETQAQTEEISREPEGLKYLGFVHVAALQAVVCLAGLYEFAKDNSGPLKPGVHSVEGAVIAVIGPVYEKFRDVPFEILKFVDTKVGEFLTEVDRHVPVVLKSASVQAYTAAEKAPEVARSLVGEVQRTWVMATASGVARDLYARCEPVAKAMYGQYEPVAERYAVAAWRSVNRLPLFPQVAQILVPTAAYWAERYNKAVGAAAARDYVVAQCLPTVPIERIAKVFGEQSEKPRATVSPPPETVADDKQKAEIAKWFLANAPAGEIQYVAKDVRSILGDDKIYEMAAAEAFPLHNKAHLLALEMPNRSGDVLIATYGELDKNNYFDPRTAQVATVDHVKQVCTTVRPANDDELPSPYIEDFRSTLDAELSKYVGETYPKGVCAVYCISGKDAEGPGADFEFVVVISAVKHSPQNFCNGIWQSIWNIEFKDNMQFVEIKGKIQVGAHYFEEGNVQLDAKLECKDSTIFQSPEDSAVSITNIVRHHETEYLASLEASYVNLPDTTFKDLRRKLPVTRTLFPWQNTMQFSLTRDITKEMGIGK
ncbi:F-actin-capping protein subunit [Musa troglodytarum]|uniref:F-actin-capping protein subunit alpha n=1 Tax=Musa troglodytarum TaxID=320322 RepID=A0A9E7ELC5_9LILI|nr:F-actin-capping protein subunit [Musa troglodytarum]